MADPTDAIPQDCVFVTGTTVLGKKMPKQVLITRSPCTEGSDAMVLKIVCDESELKGANTKDAFKFLAGLPFGAIVFPLGEPSLPARINSSDLDGDRFFYIWDEPIVNAAHHNYTDQDDDFIYKHDELVGTTIRCKGDGRKSHVGVILGKTEDGRKYLVEVESKPARKEVWTKEELLVGRTYMIRVIGHGMKNNKTWFEIEWEDGSKQKIFSSDIRKDFATPDFFLLEYVERNKLLNHKDCNWFKQHLEDRRYTKTLCKILKHRRIGSVVEVYCEYDDGVLEWEPLDEHLEESKLIVGKYARDHGLLRTNQWGVARTFWLEDVQECLIRNRSYESNLLVAKVCGMWKKACEKLGPNSAESIILGRAYKKANELEKHDVTVKLPLELYRKVVGKNEKKCKFRSLVEPIDAYVWPPLQSEVNGSNGNDSSASASKSDNDLYDGDGWGRWDEADEARSEGSSDEELFSEND